MFTYIAVLLILEITIYFPLEDNVYLEYVFNAKSFADFIYRSSVVEQLTKHNDELIDEMSALIDENIEEQKK